jgi:hypothetical protein
MSSNDAAEAMNKFIAAQKNNDVHGMLKSLPGDMHESMGKVAVELAASGHVSDAAKAKSHRGDLKRTGVAEQKTMTAEQRKAAIQAGTASDIDALGNARSAAAQKKGQSDEDYEKKAKAGSYGSVDEYKKSIVSILKQMGEKGEGKASEKVLKQLGISESEYADALRSMEEVVPTPAAAAGSPKVDIDPKTVAAAAAAAAPAPGTPAAAAGGAPAPATVKDANTAVQDTAKIASDQSKTVDEQLKTQVDEYAATSDMLSLLKKGIKYEQSWMGTKYKNVLKDATLEAFRTALIEFAVLEAKMKEDPGLQTAMANNAWNIADKGPAAMNALLTAKKGDDKIAGLLGYGGDATQGYATGGSVDYDQMAQVHKGEFVVPKGGMLVKGGEGGGKNVVVNATINVQTGADPKAIQAAVHDLYRAH